MSHYEKCSKSRIEAKATLRQPSQQGGAGNANSPQFKRSRKSALESARPSLDEIIQSHLVVTKAKISRFFGTFRSL